MEKKLIVLRIFLVLLGMMLAAPTYIFGNEVKTLPRQERFSREELNQMLAPISLYPDSILTQILMAATYPLEVVAADRWVKRNTNLKEEALDAALKDKDWPVSVKSLAHFPRVLSMMGEKIEWTRRVGNAFLAQKGDVMDTIQEQRADAESAVNPRLPPEHQAGYGQYAPRPVYVAPVAPLKIRPSFSSIFFDILFLRPAGIVALGLGCGAAVVAIPFSLPSGSSPQVCQKLIVDPFDFTFLRPLGTWKTF